MRIERRFLLCKNFSQILKNSIFASFGIFLKYQASKLERSNSLILDKILYQTQPMSACFL